MKAQKNQLEIEKQELEEKYKSLTDDYNNLSKKLEEFQNQETVDSLLKNSGPQESNKDSTANTEAEQGGQFPPETSTSQSGQTSNNGKNNVQEVVVESTEVDLTRRPNTAMPPTANQYG